MDWLIQHILVVLLIWIGLYISDYTLTLVTSRLYQAGANQHIRYEQGIELTPLYKKDVAGLRRISPRFVLILIGTTLGLWAIWQVSIPTGFATGEFEFILGALFLVEATVHMRHFRNLYSFRQFKASRGVQGNIQYAGWLSYRISSIDLLCFAALHFVNYALFRRQFFLGGAMTNLMTAIFHWLLSYRARKTAPKGTGEAQA